jgi:uncharacterized Zn-binding protein involved in type VI secretion
MRYDIRDGDRTTVNGIVSAPCRGDKLEGREIAYEGDPIWCPACNTMGRIACVGTRPRETGAGGRRSALSGDLCLCNCKQPPKLVASQCRSGCR